jgi:hypothetical protein
MGTTHVLYSNTEIALLLNYSDYCLAHDRNYKATIVTELNRVAGTDRTEKTAITKLRNTLVRDVGSSAKPEEYIKAGTVYLKVERIPGGVWKEMNRQRGAWGFEPLVATPAVAHTSIGSEGNVGKVGVISDKELPS